MPTLLHISASARGADSVSRPVGARLAADLAAAQNLAIRHRDLGRDPPPWPDADFMEASLARTEPRGADTHPALALSEALIGELTEAAMIVIDTPMHNFTVPAVLKAWLDLVLRPGRSFSLGRQGKLGLLADRPVFAIIACGGRLARDPADTAAQQDFLTPYLRYALGIAGLRHLAVLHLEAVRAPGADLTAIAARADTWIAAQLAALDRSGRPAV